MNTSGTRKPRRTKSTVAHEAKAEEEESVDMEERERARSKVTAAAELAAAPVKEVYFVGLGVLDWALEQVVSLERTLAGRGERRSEAMKQAASRLGSSVTSKAAPMLTKASKGVEKLGESVASGSRKLRSRMPASEPADPATGELHEAQPA